MAPALTKVLEDGHAIHLSSPLSSVRLDSSVGAVRGAELDSHVRSTGDGDAQKTWLNLSLVPSLDSCLPMSPLDVPSSHLLSPYQQLTARQCESAVLPSPASLLSFLSYDESHRDSHQVVSVLPGVPDMFLGPVPEHNSQTARLLPDCGASSECGPDGGDVHCSPFSLTSISALESHGKIHFQENIPLFEPISALTQGKAAGVGSPPPATMQSCSGSVNLNQLLSRTALEDAVKEQLSRQAGLHSRAWKLKRRLQILLGEHALLHCSQQLDGLKRHCQLGDVSHNSLDSSHPGILLPQSGSKPYLCLVGCSAASSSFTEFREFCRSSQEVLRGLQEALDSDATASSSSEDELEEDKSRSKNKTSPVSSSCERRWLEARAELGSRWSWLRLRLAELEGRIQQLVELHKHIRSSKGGVVLAETQPLTDRQIQQTLLWEMAGLSCTASDADTEPCSPTHLLNNIQRQSAQLSQIVNSLMPPLSFSPLSKQAQTCKVKRNFTSSGKGDAFFLPGTSKRRKMATTRFFKADVSCVCARTRPLVTYHKPKLFSLNTYKPSSPQDTGKFSSTLSSSLSSFFCSCCSSCDPVVLCSDPDCSYSLALSSSKQSSRPHHVLSPSFDVPLSPTLQRSLRREEWSQRPLNINVETPTPAHFSRRSSTPLHSSHKWKEHARHHKGRVMGLSPIRMTGSAQSQRRRAKQRKRRRHIHRLIEDEQDVLYHHLEESSDEVLEESCTQVSHKQTSQGSIRKRQGESVYNINNIVIPLSLAKVEKLQYKDILTPRWRLLSTQSVMEIEAEEEDHKDGLVEDLRDECFARRHMAFEQKEKLRWYSWGKRKSSRRPTRSGSKLSGGGGGVCTSGEESSVEWSGAQLDTDEQPSSEEWLPQTPWQPRVFPLDEKEEEAMFCDELENIPSGWLESVSASSSKNSNSQLSPAHTSDATLPSGAHSTMTAPNGS
ncbi:KAT8 regulatory NSL complex subunit 1-like protein isoform X3 [Echeneis naucrates]|uniref:KAT8 regulatory NSL complex subunit 1-like protein isoform X3 n=1 Tax=Echeneis naucrates TaxID=173247 RepID=UPI0011143AE4|nr:KAT8 regulatory NSL complex subunit 1-like protein isoform X3 [Echeneis naucrates]